MQTAVYLKAVQARHSLALLLTQDVSQQHMKKHFKTIIVVMLVLVPIIMLGLLSWIFSPKIPEGSEILPTKVILEKESPNKKITAQILEGEQIEGVNLLGSNYRYYLTIKYPNARHLILRDLSEGFGSYEGGVIDLNWIDSNRVYIERIVSDQQADLIYDISINTWQDVTKK